MSDSEEKYDDEMIGTMINNYMDERDLSSSPSEEEQMMLHAAHDDGGWYATIRKFQQKPIVKMIVGIFMTIGGCIGKGVERVSRSMVNEVRHSHIGMMLFGDDDQHSFVSSFYKTQFIIFTLIGEHARALHAATVGTRMYGAAQGAIGWMADGFAMGMMSGDATLGMSHYQMIMETGDRVFDDGQMKYHELMEELDEEPPELIDEKVIGAAVESMQQMVDKVVPYLQETLDGITQKSSDQASEVTALETSTIGDLAEDWISAANIFAGNDLSTVFGGVDTVQQQGLEQKINELRQLRDEATSGLQSVFHQVIAYQKKHQKDIEEDAQLTQALRALREKHLTKKFETKVRKAKQKREAVVIGDRQIPWFGLQYKGDTTKQWWTHAVFPFMYIPHGKGRLTIGNDDYQGQWKEGSLVSKPQITFNGDVYKSQVAKGPCDRNKPHIDVQYVEMEIYTKGTKIFEGKRCMQVKTVYDLAYYGDGWAFGSVEARAVYFKPMLEDGWMPKEEEALLEKEKERMRIRVERDMKRKDGPHGWMHLADLV